MLKKTITYEDFNGDETSEDFHFHLSKAELVELELSHQGGLSEALQRIVESEDGKAIIAEFKNIILSSYGQRSPDGKRFIKNQQLRDEFESSEAYSTLFMELVLNAEAAIEFINGVIPGDMSDVAAQVAKPDLKTVESVTVLAKPNPEAPLIPKTELITMSYSELQEVRKKAEAGEVRLEQ